jgi:integrase
MATKLPSGTYRTLVLLDKSKRKYKSFTGKTADEANAKAISWKMSHLMKKEGQQSFYKAAKNFLMVSGPALSPYTVRGYTSILETIRDKYLAFSRTDLSDITKDDLQRLYNEMLEAGRKPKTVKNYHGFISAVFSYYDVPLPKAKLPEVRRPDLNIPTQETLSRLLRASEGTRMEIPIKLGLRGLRRGEVCAVRVSDLDGNILHVQRSMTWVGNRYVTKAPKTPGSDRLVPLPDDVADQIRQQGSATTMTPRQLTAAFHRLVSRKSLNLPAYRFHDLRHAFVSLAHANNIPDAYIMSMGGWSTSSTMQRVYRHTLDDRVAKYQSQMEKVLKKL